MMADMAQTESIPALTPAKIKQYLSMQGWRENGTDWEYPDQEDAPSINIPDASSDDFADLLRTLSGIEARSEGAIKTDIQNVDQDVIRLTVARPAEDPEAHIPVGDAMQVLSAMKGMIYALAEDKFEGIGKSQLLDLFHLAQSEDDNYVFVIAVHETDYDDEVDRNFLNMLMTTMRDLVLFAETGTFSDGSSSLIGVSRKFVNSLRRLARTAGKGSIGVDVRWSHRSQQREAGFQPIEITRALDRALKDIMDEIDEIPLPIEFVGLITRFVRDIESGDFVQVSVSNVLAFEGEEQPPESIRIDLEAEHYAFAEQAFLDESAIRFEGSINRSGMSYKVDEIIAFELNE